VKVHASEPAVAPDRGGITAFQGSSSDQPPRQVNGVDSPQQEDPAMETRLPFVVLVLGCLLAVAGRTGADDAPKPDLKPLLKEVRKVIEKHYPKATVTLKDQTIHFEFNTRKFMIHEPTLTGEWQDAREGKTERCQEPFLTLGSKKQPEKVPDTFTARFAVTFLLLLAGGAAAIAIWLPYIKLMEGLSR
jgi:hypothetical protein